MPIYTFSCFIQLSTRALNVQIPPFTTKWYSREVFLTKRSYLLPGGASYTNYSLNLLAGGFLSEASSPNLETKQTTEFTGLT